MVVQKEIWIASIIGALFAENSFLSKAFNADEYVNEGKRVHIPQAGRPSGVTKNRGELPASVSRRTDDDLTFDLDEYTTDPVHIPHADTVELSYDKRESVIRQDKLALMDEVATAIADAWMPEKAANKIKTATGALAKADVLKVMERFNALNIPQEGRYMLLDAKMHAQLLQDLTESESVAFVSSADAQRGIIGGLYSFKMMLRSTVGSPVETVSEEGETVFEVPERALAWHEQSVCRALGEVKMFDRTDDPTYYGDIYSFLVRCGGRKMRKDETGVMLITNA